jgi:hypothetical protein
MVFLWQSAGLIDESRMNATVFIGVVVAVVVVGVEGVAGVVVVVVVVVSPTLPSRIVFFPLVLAVGVGPREETRGCTTSCLRMRYSFSVHFTESQHRTMH